MATATILSMAKYGQVRSSTVKDLVRTDLTIVPALIGLSVWYISRGMCLCLWHYVLVPYYPRLTFWVYPIYLTSSVIFCDYYTIITL